jgi:hypothetical protein
MRPIVGSWVVVEVLTPQHIQDRRTELRRSRVGEKQKDRKQEEDEVIRWV